MQNESQKVLGPKFKFYFFAITVIFSAVICLWVNTIKLLDGDLSDISADLYPYSLCILFIFVIAGMILDEYIRKYPGFLVLIGTSIYTLCYIGIAIAFGGYSSVGFVILLMYLLFVGVSVLLYKYFYPLLVVKNKHVKIFNTCYLVIVLLITISIGTIYWL